MKRLSKPNAKQLATLRAHAHPRCVVCGAANPLGLGLECVVMPDASVAAEFAGGEALEGYADQLHGGMIAALLDGAMTHCLFAHGCRALTAELTVRFRHPVAVKERLTVRAWLADSHAPLHLLRAELWQNGQVKATALGKFFESHD
jgi:acyl-coenzyme A thioesterase PaaI-like protein